MQLTKQVLYLQYLQAPSHHGWIINVKFEYVSTKYPWYVDLKYPIIINLKNNFSNY